MSFPSDMLLVCPITYNFKPNFVQMEGKKETKATFSTNFSLLLGLFCTLTLNCYNSKCSGGLKDKRGAFKCSRNDLFIVVSSIVSEALLQVVEAG